MADPWIKMRGNLRDDPAVIAIAGALKLSQDDIVGKLHHLWAWADQHTTDGRVNGVGAPWVDQYVGRRGFAGAMCGMLWLEIDATGITFPKFTRHNGKSAKLRAEDQLRKAREQAEREAAEAAKASGNFPEKNRKESGQTADEIGTETGLEIEIDNKELKAKTKSKTKPTREPPTAFAPPDWVPRREWDDFDDMRRRKGGKAWTMRARELATEDLAKLVEAGEDPAAVLRQSVSRTWSGLFPVGSRGKPNGRLSSHGQQTAEAAQRWIDQEEAKDASH